MYRCLFIAKQQFMDDVDGFLKHLFLNSILSVQKMVQADEIIIAFDSKKNWRKSIYPGYKANRREKRDDDIDWKNFFNFFEMFHEELKVFPFKVLKIDYAEADDIIAVLCDSFKNKEITIVSSDKDFKQLLRLENVDLYDPMKNTIVDIKNPIEYLTKHILQGDNSDNIKDVKSTRKNTIEFDEFLKEKYKDKKLSLSDNLKAELEFLRQNNNDYSKVCEWKSGRIGPKTAEKILKDKEELEKLKNTKNYKLNEILIDLRKVPKIVKKKIKIAYDDIQGSIKFTKDEIREYFIQNEMLELLDVIDSDIEVFFGGLS